MPDDQTSPQNLLGDEFWMRGSGSFCLPFKSSGKKTDKDGKTINGKKYALMNMAV